MVFGYLHVTPAVSYCATAAAVLAAFQYSKKKNDTGSRGQMKSRYGLPEAARCEGQHETSSSVVELKGENPVIIIGGGIAGVTTAHALIAKHYDVTIIDANSELSTQASSVAAGSMLRANHALGAYDWSETMKSMIPNDPKKHFEEFLALRFNYTWGPLFDLTIEEAAQRRAERDYKFFKLRPIRCLFDPHFYRWLFSLMRFSLFPSDTLKAAQLEMLKFSDWSITKLVDTIEEEQIACGYSDDKVVTVYSTEAALDRAKNTKDVMVLPQKYFWSAEEMIDKVPSARQSSIKWVGASHMRSEMADCHRFVLGLADRIKDKVTFLMNRKVTGFTSSTNAKKEIVITSIATTHGTIRTTKGDGTPIPVVIAIGAWAPHLCAKLGYYVPVYPIKGYDLLLDVSDAVNDDSRVDEVPTGILNDSKLFIVRVGERLRIASMGELSGWCVAPSGDSYDIMRGRAVAVLPQLAKEICNAPFLPGLRPVVSDGILLSGLLPQSANAFVTAGPGFNGWKTSMGAAELTARSVEAATMGDDVASAVQKDLQFDARLVLPGGRVSYSPTFAKICDILWNSVS